MLRKTITPLLSFVLLMGFLVPTVIPGVYAEDLPGTIKPGGQDLPGTITPASPLSSYSTLKSPFAFETVAQLVSKILLIVVKVGWVLAFFFLIWSGFLFVTAAGSEEKLKTAKDTFVWTIVGSCIVLGAQVLSKVIETTVKNVVGS